MQSRSGNGTGETVIHFSERKVGPSSASGRLRGIRAARDDGNIGGCIPLPPLRAVRMARIGLGGPPIISLLGRCQLLSFYFAVGVGQGSA
jgi:hypothetical protein